MAQDAAAARDIPALAKTSGKLTHGAATALRPLTRLAISGRTLEVVDFEDADGVKTTAIRVNNIAPLDWLATRSKDKLDPHQFEAGKRARGDFARARSSSIRIVEASSQALYRTAEMMRDQKDWSGRGQASAQPRNASGASDARLDAVRRLGQLLDRIGSVSFFLIEQVVVFELSLAEVSTRTGEDQRYVSRRFREALDNAAAFYQLAPKGYVAHPGHDGLKPISRALTEERSR
jgi:hypothetical protein